MVSGLEYVMALLLVDQLTRHLNMGIGREIERALLAVKRWDRNLQFLIQQFVFICYDLDSVFMLDKYI